MAWFTPAELPDNRYFIFGEGGGKGLAEKHEVPLLGQIPLVQTIRENGDQGTPAILQQDTPAALLFGQLAEEVARQISIRNAVAPKTNIVEMNR